MSSLFDGVGGKADRPHEGRRALKDEWLTPPHILRALGEFDLDPCAPVSPPWKTAERSFTIFDNGLAQPWEGRVWMNPPYGNETPKWMRRLADHGNGVSLICARTETGAFFPWVWEHATAFLFLKGRLHFHHVNGQRAASPIGAPSMLIAYGQENAEALKHCGLPGKFLGNQ